MMSIALLASCSDSDSDSGQPANTPELTVNKTEVSIEGIGGETTIEVSSSSTYTVTGGMGWVTATPADGNIKLKVEENLWQKAREAVLTLTNSEQMSQAITIKQEAQAYNDNHHYKLPVIFHVLYYKDTDEKQYVREGHMGKLLDLVNKLYDNCGVNIPIDFVPVTHTPEGELLPEPGVHRVKTKRSTYDPSMIMSGKTKEISEMMWDPSRYINVFVTKFTEIAIAGISQFPILPEPYELAGMSQAKKGSNINANPYPQCVCINNEYIYELPKSDNAYEMGDPSVTIAHELGHFLGLKHAFNQTDNGQTNWNEDTDHCTDTEPYNKFAYDQQLQQYLNTYGIITSKTSEAYGTYVMRIHSSTNKKFRSTNIMDYAVSDANRFTAQQNDRVRYVLHHGLYRPGPKDYSKAEIVEGPVTRQAETNNFKPHFID